MDSLRKDCLDSFFAGQRRTVSVGTVGSFAVESVGALFLPMNVVKFSPLVPVGRRAPGHFAVWAKIRVAKIINFETVKASGHRMTPVDLDYKSKQKSTAEEEGQSLR